MAIVLVGASCSSKSVIARELKEKIGFKVYQGRDYLNLGRNEQDAWQQFSEMLADKSKCIIYVTGNIEKYKQLKEAEGVRIYKIFAPLSYMKDKLKIKLDMEELSDDLVANLEDDLAKWAEQEEINSYCVNNSASIDVIVKCIIDEIAALRVEKEIDDAAVYELEETEE